MVFGPTKARFTREEDRNSDAYFTPIDVAKQCVSSLMTTVNNYKDYLFLEPSCGEGVFVKAFSELKSEDIKIVTVELNPTDYKPTHVGDFLTFSKEVLIGENKCITFGNPPFGKNASLAVKFFNHAATFSDYIAFIVPKSFEKDSIMKRLNSSMQVVERVDLGDCKFSKKRNSGSPPPDKVGSPSCARGVISDDFKVPTLWMIWKKQEELSLSKNKVSKNENSRITFHTKTNIEGRTTCDFVIQRIGNRAGRMFFDNWDKYLTSQNFYFIEIKDLKPEELEDIKDHKLDLENIESKFKTASTNHSVTKGDVSEFLNKYLK